MTLSDETDLYNRAVCSVAQTCLSLCSPMHSSSPGSSARGTFQARILQQGTTSSTPGNLPDPGIKPEPPVPPPLAGGFVTPESPGKPCSAQHCSVETQKCSPLSRLHTRDSALQTRELTYKRTFISLKVHNLRVRVQELSCTWAVSVGAYTLHNADFKAHRQGSRYRGVVNCMGWISRQCVICSQ